MKLRIITESDQFFSYRNFWNELLYAAQEEQKISFDLENNDSTDRQEVSVGNSKFKCELCAAGGDWECSTNYFRIQHISGPSTDKSEFIWIPSIKEGNLGLIKCKSVYCPPDGDDPDAIEPDDELCWSSLKQHLENLLENSGEE